MADQIATCESAVRVCTDQERRARRAFGRGDIQAAEAAANVADRAAEVARNAAAAAGPVHYHPYENHQAYRAERLA